VALFRHQAQHREEVLAELVHGLLPHVAPHGARGPVRAYLAQGEPSPVYIQVKKGYRVG
jgi:hypothetical protein